MKVYISGPITGRPGLNRAAFDAAEQALAEAGHEPVNPFHNGQPREATWLQHMRADLAMLLQCDGLATLPDWLDSKGARTEVHLANQLGYRVRTLEAWINDGEGA